MIKTVLVAVLFLCFTLIPDVEAATVGELMCTATEPIGKCLYVYGGGWNEEDTAAGVEALNFGISPGWTEFYNKNGSEYNYKTTRYQIHNGLDCTGYVGWCMYQLFGDSYSENGYVVVSNKMADEYKRIFSAEVAPAGTFKEFRCGDIMTMVGHAYIVLGQCSDGSVVFMHASPPAVSLCGTYTPGGKKNSQAVWLAEEYMKKHFPQCHERYPNRSKDTSYLTDYHRISLPAEILSDTDGYRSMSAEYILFDMFDTVKLYVDGKRTGASEGLYIIEGSTYVPLRAAAEALNADVKWKSDTKEVIISTGYNSISVSVGSSVAHINGEGFNMPGDVFISGDRTYVPVRFIAEHMGASVSWNGKWKKVLIKSN